MNTTLIIAAIALFLFMFMSAGSIFDNFSACFVGMLCIAASLKDKYPLFITAFYCYMLFMGALYIIISLRGMKYKSTIMDIESRRFSWLVRRVDTKQQKIRKANIYILLEGVVCVLFGMIGLAFPESAFALIQ